VGSRPLGHHPDRRTTYRLKNKEQTTFKKESFVDQIAFSIDRALHEIIHAIQTFPKAAMFALAEDGYDSLFEQLVACIISIRTFDEVSLVAARRLFTLARTPEEIAASTPSAIDERISETTFHERKAAQNRCHASASESSPGSWTMSLTLLRRSVGGWSSIASVSRPRG
jgi:endonuclease III